MDTCCGANENEGQFERLTQQIANLELREAELAEVPTVENGLALAGVREQRESLERELEELWARRGNRC